MRTCVHHNVPDSTPVTFADVLRYHRKKASDNRADQAWHAEAVECLRILALEAAEGCISACETESVAGCSEESCPIWQASKAVEGET